VSIVSQATVCYCSGVEAPTIGESHLVYILSNNRRLHQSTFKSSTLDELSYYV